jgi:hypothetical protein
MQSDFELSCKTAREAIAVPAISWVAIRRGVQNRPSERAGRRRHGVIAAIVAGLSIAAAAAAAELFGHVQISLNPSGAMHLYFDGTAEYRPVRNPTDEDFQKAARAMSFPVILPKGLPNGTRAEGLIVLGSGAMQILYDLPGAWRRSNHLLIVMLANPKSVARESAKPPRSKGILILGQTTGTGPVRWMVGQEEVIVLKSTITPAELAHFKAAMMAQGH